MHEILMQYQSYDHYKLSTDEFAEIHRVKSQSVRARLCRTGSYFGVRPKKLANGRMVWPAIQVEKGNA